MDVYLIVGLGNPGTKYAHTRHNVGFDVVEILAQKMGIRLNKRKSKAIVGEGTWHGKRVVLAQPQTYMNLSGESVVPLIGWYKPPVENLVLVYDDVDLPPGSVRIRASGSSGTHNGMRSVIGLLGRTDFPRVRVGIGGPPEGWDMADWVTGHYPTAEARKVAFDSYMTAADAVLTLIDEGIEPCMRKHNLSPKAAKKKEEKTDEKPADHDKANTVKKEEAT